MEKLVLIGYFSETKELCEKCMVDIKGIVDNSSVGGCSNYIGNDDYFVLHKEEYTDCKLFISPDSPLIRKRLYDLYHNCGFSFLSLISPNSIVSKSALIENGTMIQDNCNISANVRIGKMVRVNTGAIVMHDSSIEDFCTVAPAAVLLGKCVIEEGAYIGANATILPGITIHKGAVVGAGAVVTKDVDEGEIVVGIPAKPIIYEHE